MRLPLSEPSVHQKSSTYTRKSPQGPHIRQALCTHTAEPCRQPKSPTYTQKNPTPTHRKGPCKQFKKPCVPSLLDQPTLYTALHKLKSALQPPLHSALHTPKTALHTRKRALHTPKRALHTRKRALHTLPKALHLSQIHQPTPHTTSTASSPVDSQWAMKCVAVCCSVLQCVAVCCSVS